MVIDTSSTADSPKLVTTPPIPTETKASHTVSEEISSQFVRHSEWSFQRKLTEEVREVVELDT
jgi:hypothetical protein